MPPSNLYSGPALEFWTKIHSDVGYRSLYADLSAAVFVDRIEQLCAGSRINLVWLGVGSGDTELEITKVIHEKDIVGKLIIHDELPEQVERAAQKFKEKFSSLPISTITGDFHGLTFPQKDLPDSKYLIGILGLTMTNITDFDVVLEGISRQLDSKDLFMADFLFDKTNGGHPVIVTPDKSSTQRPDMTFSDDEVTWFKLAYANYQNTLSRKVSIEQIEISFPIQQFNGGYCVNIEANVKGEKDPHTVVRLLRCQNDLVDRIFRENGFYVEESYGTNGHTHLKIVSRS